MTTQNPFACLPEPLLAWYRDNARDLPWRRERDPYPIWISEIMLQQTRVAAALDYYRRFLEAFPTVEALAQAPEERLMKLWEGLGYYSRARNLQKAARQIVAGGGFPQDYQQWLALPGVGEYTAAAVVSAAFGQRQAAVDGNVLRLAARLTDCHEDILSPAVRRNVRRALEAVLPPAGEQMRIFNQATMELGATVCVPKGEPRCQACPAREFCLGRFRGTAQALPVRGAKKTRRVEEKTVFVLLRQGKVALRQRAPEGLLASLWEFPWVEGIRGESAAAAAVEAWGMIPRAWKSQLAARHIFTHVEWHMSGYVLEAEGQGPEEFVWMDLPALDAHAVPSAFARYAEAARKELEGT